jgi:hypothetical protein
MERMLARVQRFLMPPADLEPRLGIFVVLCRVGAVLSLAVVIPVNLLQGLPLVVSVMTGMFGLLCLGLYAEAKRKRYHLVTFTLSFLVALDLAYFPNAASAGSVPFYFFPLILLPLVFHSGRARQIGVALIMVNWLLLLLVERFVPGLATPFENDFARLVDLLTGLAVSGVSVTLIMVVVLS